METKELKVGVKGTDHCMVDKDNTAQTMGSGLLPVFATPAMIALMEKTASESVAAYLEDGCGTVGTALNVQHTAATPVGMQVFCESELTQIDGRKLVFSVRAYDEKGTVGRGTHERFIINNEPFLEKAQAKLQ